MKKFSSWKLTRPPTFGHELHYPFCETRTSPALAIIVARPPSCRSLLTTWPVFLYFVQKLPRWKHTLWSVDDERMPEPAPPIFGRSDQPIPTRGESRLSPPCYYLNLRFLATKTKLGVFLVMSSVFLIHVWISGNTIDLVFLLANCQWVFGSSIIEIMFLEANRIFLLKRSGLGYC